MNDAFLLQIDRRLARLERLLLRTLDDQTLTVAQAADRLGLSPWTIRRAIKQENLPATRPAGSRKYRIKVCDLLKWDRNRIMPPGNRLAKRANKGPV
jgi:excisionase family DNA binding protein